MAKDFGRLGKGSERPHCHALEQAALAAERCIFDVAASRFHACIYHGNLALKHVNRAKAAIILT